jgi:BirA family biotin operon repressor/biotin-[acetyl-CoA-carboxylase] ligase
VIRAVEAASPAAGLMLKWPNDLMMGADKLAGVLLERSGDRLVAGFGVNLCHAPDLPDRPAAALGSVASLTPQSFAPLLAASFARALDLWRSDLPRLLTSWLESAHPVGTALSVHAAADQVVTGEFAGIDMDGALQLRLADGSTRVIHAADVSLA